MTEDNAGSAESTGIETRAPGRRRVKRAFLVPAVAVVVAGLVGGLSGVVVVRHFEDSDHAPPAAVGGVPVHNASASGGAGSVSAVAAAVRSSVVELRVTSRRGSVTGSGVVLDTAGRILTNDHVVAGAGSGGVTVVFADGRAAAGTVSASDAAHDLAVVRVSGVGGLTPAVLGDSASLQVGDGVVAFGSPLGLGGTVTSGVVGALNRPITTSGESAVVPDDASGARTSPIAATDSNTVTYPAIQTDVAFGSGSSGGPLVDLSGRVVGIDSAIYDTTSEGGDDLPRGGSGVEADAGSVGITFAIPIDVAKTFLNTLGPDA
ncbi:S1C family serine protease [Embleya hyalina]|uniref:Serine protease PepD n=1 Tax=Embleya hyalina TaxID=516124 RepID=A0A401YZZ5_9ACTN|nr:trypsin-like peptidase domain-containing protein [Embleya hyalina]GCE00195.1 serine protease PepD [Embleya hyalina]